MKKVLSLVLAFAMILGSFGFVFASNFSDVKDNEYYSEAVNVLSGFGVIAGFPDGTFKPGENVTRAQMATMITAALGIPVKGSGATGFSDVPASHWASGYIAYAVSVGFVAGYPDKTFKPENPVSYNEALTMIVASLGYTAEVLPGSWPGAFVNQARGLGILDTCATTGNAAAPRQDIACFLYDGLTAQIGYVDKDGEWHANANGTDTMIKRLGAVDYDGGNGAGKAFVVDGDEESLINMDEYFGAYITAYASKDDKETIVAVKEVLSEFIEGKINDKKTTIKGDSEYKITSTTEQVKAFKYFNNADVVSKDYDATTGKTMKFAVKLSGSKIVEVYSAQEWTAAGTFRAEEDIQEELADEMTLDGQYKFIADEDDDEKIDESEFIMVGKTALADLAEDDVITVYLDKNNKVAKLEVSTDTIEGAIAKVAKDGSTYTIAGTEYDVVKTADGGKAAGMSPDDEGTFYLNYAGEIFDFEGTETTKNFAVVLDAGKDEGRYGAVALYLKMFIEDGTVAEFKVDASSKGKMASFIEYDTVDTTKAIGWDGTPAFVGTVVEYSLDSDDVVVQINESGYTAFTPSGTSFDDNGINNKQALKSSTVAFTLVNGGDPTDSDDLGVMKAEDLFGKDFVSATGLVDKGDVVAILVEGAEESNDVYAIFADDDYQKVADGKTEWTALYDGAVKTYTLAKGEEAEAAAFTSASAIKLFKFSFDKDNVVKIDEVASGKYNAVTDVDISEKLTVSGNVIKAKGKNYSLASDVAVYVYDESDEKWTASSKLTAAKYEYLVLIGTKDASDEEFDIVVAIRK